VSRRVPARWLASPVFGIRDVGAGDVAFAVVLSGLGAADMSGLTGSSIDHEGVAASLAVLLMTAPVVFARREPVLAAATLAAGAGLNWVLFDHLVRCGAALPAVFYVGFVIGSRWVNWSEAVSGVALLAVNLVCQAYSDPRLGGPSILLDVVPITVGFTVAGRLLQARSAAVARLRVRTAALRDQREQNARLAVAADQARIAGDLDGFLHDRVGRIAAAAAAGRARLASEPDQAEEVFVAIQDTGRETLTHMRGLVADLKDQAPTRPQPVLAQLDRLLGQATEADTRLQVTGDPRLLPPGLELSGYRIVEHLLVALENDPTARIDVAVAFGPDALELTVVGPSARRGDIRPALAAATERAALHGGSLHSEASGGRRTTVVLLPLAGGHV
jgi:signal transduction histidine kinase